VERMKGGKERERKERITGMQCGKGLGRSRHVYV